MSPHARERESPLQPYDSPAHSLAPWFAQWRAERAAARRCGPGARSRALITIVNDEPVFLPIFLRYYSQTFGAGDIYVLDNGPPSRPAATGGFVRIPAPGDRVDHVWMAAQVQALQHRLLERYDVVVAVDVDELLVPAPGHGTLSDYLDGFSEDWVNCLGYELIHLRESEPPLRLAQRILAQRGHWFANAAYNKASVARVAIEWGPGFHGRADGHLKVDPDLRLVHLHRVDYDICLARHRARSRREWAPVDAREGWAVHNTLTEEPEFGRWFYEDTGFDGFPVIVEPIHPAWRGLL